MPVFRLASLAALACGVLFAAPDEPKKPTPKFKLGKDTTYIDGPLDKDGYLDYEAALNERLKGKTTPETNAVVLLLKCFGPKPEGTALHADFYKARGIEAPPEKGEYLVPHGKHFQEEVRSEDAKDFSDLESRLRTRPWKPADAPKHAEWLKLNEKPLAIAVESTLRKDYFHPMISRKQDGGRGTLMNGPLPTVQKCREIAALLSLRTTLKLGEGKTDDAFVDALALHRLARLVGHGCMIELLVGISIQAIAHSAELATFEHGKPTAKQSLAYRDELLKLPPMPAVAEKLQITDRFVYLDAIETCRRDGFGALGENPMQNRDEMEKLAQTIDWEVIFRIGNAWYDKSEAAMRKPSRAERVAAANDIIHSIKKMKRDLENMTVLQKLVMRIGEPDKVRARISEKIGKVYISLLLPAFQLVGDAADRADQGRRNGVLAAALAAHFADTQKYPDKLADLAPKYLAKVPDDVFSGKPLVYTKTKTGYLFYSVGVNGVDDGGQLLSEEPRGDDLGVRMPRK